jgi:hypothetical protein
MLFMADIICIHLIDPSPRYCMGSLGESSIMRSVTQSSIDWCRYTIYNTLDRALQFLPFVRRAIFNL